MTTAGRSTATGRDARQVAEWLRSCGIDAEPYHGGEGGDAERRQVLGGPQFVVHFQRPGSVVHYYQQVGRAGRQMESAWGVLLSGDEDDEIVDWFIETAFPSEAHVEAILEALDDPDAAPCGRCAPCRGKALLPVAVDRSLTQRATEFFRKRPLRFPPRKQLAKGALSKYGWTRLPSSFEEGRVLCEWARWGYGALVRDGKASGTFADELVDAAAELVSRRWMPAPAPAWVARVPSRRAPGLVPSFAQRLAVRLGIPFSPCVEKVLDTPPQKGEQNAFRQARNLDGAFRVDRGEVPPGACLLVDDVVDSGWTLTVVAALLREAGCPKVDAFALADAGRRAE